MIEENNLKEINSEQNEVDLESNGINSEQKEIDTDKKETHLNELRELNEFCKSFGCCLRCQLRFLGELYSAAIFLGTKSELQDRINEILKIDNDKNSFKKLKKDSFCYCCIGLLDDKCEDDNINQILNKVTEFEYKFKKFQINLSLPIAITIRENAMNAKLLNRFRDLDEHLKECYSVKDVYKYYLIRKISKLTDSKFSTEARTDIEIDTNYGNNQLDCMELYKNCKNLFHLDKNKKFESIFNQTAVNKALLKLGLKDYPDRPISIESIKLTNHPLYLVGRYNKLCRNISQTPWFLNENEKRMRSVEEILTVEMKKNIPHEKSKFLASGREDVDVRMLGSIYDNKHMLGRGRPFAVELCNPARLDIDIKIFEKIKEDIKLASNNEVNVNDLQFANKDDLLNLKKGEMEKEKTYKALCVSSRAINQNDIDKLNEIKELTIQQETPIRVLHRRTLSTRPKLIKKLKIELIDNETHKFNLIVTTEAGTYVKEFVNSDFGRTSPSLETLLGDCETDILQLDVMEIEFDWPPKIDQLD